MKAHVLFIGLMLVVGVAVNSPRAECAGVQGCIKSMVEVNKKNVETGFSLSLAGLAKKFIPIQNKDINRLIDEIANGFVRLRVDYSYSKKVLASLSCETCSCQKGATLTGTLTFQNRIKTPNGTKLIDITSGTGTRQVTTDGFFDAGKIVEFVAFSKSQELSLVTFELKKPQDVSGDITSEALENLINHTLGVSIRAVERLDCLHLIASTSCSCPFGTPCPFVNNRPPEIIAPSEITVVLDENNQVIAPARFTVTVRDINGNANPVNFSSSRASIVAGPVFSFDGKSVAYVLESKIVDENAKFPTIKLSVRDTCGAGSLTTVIRIRNAHKASAMVTDLETLVTERGVVNDAHLGFEVVGVALNGGWQ